MSSSHFVAGISAVGMMILNPGIACGQEYPGKPIRIVTTPAGSGSDFAARIIAQELTSALGQTVIIDNRPTGPIQGEILSKAPPDGYTLLLASQALWLTPLLQDNVSYDPVRDFAPITLVERSPNVLVVHPSLPVKSVRQLIALAKSRPGELNYGSSAAGGASHLAGELFKSMAGVSIVWVPYKSSAQAVQAMLGGDLQLIFSGGGTVAPFLKAGRLRALAVTGLRPSTLVPGLPTVAESGLPGYEIEAIAPLLAPGKTPAAIIKRLNQEIVLILNKPEVKGRLLTGGIEVATSSPEELGATIKSEIAKWAKLIKETGIKAN